MCIGVISRKDATHAANEGQYRGGEYFVMSWNFAWLGFLMVLSKEDLFFFPFA